MNNRELQRKFDRIAASRLSRIEGGVPRHIALSNRGSIVLRNKLERMGLYGPHIEAAIAMVDEMGLQEVLSTQPLGSRFATIPQAKRPPNIWTPNDD
jgi:hypothetical protein